MNQVKIAEGIRNGLDDGKKVNHGMVSGNTTW
jgi:hypothetical protein